MTAAALRPDLFNHLFATQRHNPDQGDLAASAISLTLHAAVVAAMIWAGTTIKPDASSEVEKVAPLVLYTHEPVQSSEGGGGGGAINHSSQPALTLPDFTNLPDPAPPVNPSEPWVEPGPPAPGPPRDPTQPGTGIGTGEELRDGFVVSRTMPAILNRPQVEQALQRNYPAILRDSGIGGTVMLWLLVDENGRVTDAQIKDSSGHEALDKAAMKVGEVIRFSAGMNHDSRVKVWVALPVVFRTQ